MQIEITKKIETERYVGIEATVGKISGVVFCSRNFLNDGKCITALCKNASHRAWRGMGKTFRSWDAAFDAYKSKEMKTIIEYARNLDNN